MKSRRLVLLILGDLHGEESVAGSVVRVTATAESGISESDVAAFRDLHARVAEAVEVAVQGKRVTVELVLTAMFAGGHVLLEDVPGTGKTTLARSVAAALGGQSRRIQFTPDLLPSDVTGTSVFDPRSGGVSFRAGPVFANVVLADERGDIVRTLSRAPSLSGYVQGRQIGRNVEPGVIGMDWVFSKPGGRLRVERLT